MKVTRIGWVGKRMNTEIWIDGDNNVDKTLNLSQIFLHRGIKQDWNDNDWPPRKVEIIVRDAK